MDYAIQSQIALNEALTRKAHAEADLALAHTEKMRAETKRILAQQGTLTASNSSVEVGK